MKESDPQSFLEIIKQNVVADLNSVINIAKKNKQDLSDIQNKLEHTYETNVPIFTQEKINAMLILIKKTDN